MALDLTFAAAFIDNGAHHRLLGRRLKPFSLWHRFLLQAVNSPFFYGDELKFFDMREAIGICRLSFPNSKIRRPWVIPLVCFFFLGFPRSQWIKFLKRTRDKLLDYFGDYISKPEYSIKDPDPYAPPSPPIGQIPENFIILADVIGFLNCSEAHAWNMPIGQAYWYQMAACRHRGDQVDFMDEDERNFQTEAKEKLQGVA